MKTPKIPPAREDTAHSRRSFLAKAALAAFASNSLLAQKLEAQSSATGPVLFAQTPVLTIGYQETGSAQGFPVFLLHGFPDDIHAFDNVVPPLAQAGYRAIVPYLRGYGPTRFRDANAPRMGEQAAMAQDVVDLADALHIQKFALVGYDWGGRASGIVAALHPERVRAMVLIGGYTIQDTTKTPPPAKPETERALWYQWYFNTERGRAGLAANRRSLCKLLWQTWSPTWHFTDETYNRTADSFDNPDFVDVVSTPIATAMRMRRASRVLPQSNRNWHVIRRSRCPQLLFMATATAWRSLHQMFRWIAPTSPRCSIVR